MTIYSVKVDKHQIRKTTELHEARAIAKQALIQKLKERCDDTYDLLSTSEKLYTYSNNTQIRLFTTVYKREEGMKTYSVTIKCINVPKGHYDFNLYKEIYSGWKN
jgi:hypothetical protein